MLERIAVHQTRLRVPGVSLDARGVALGARGLVLLPSVDRLVAFLAIFTRDRGLDSLGALQIRVVKSKLGARELTLAFDAGSSDRMDRVAEVARLAGGFTFTGSTRHFVQYRDQSAPFGFDAPELSAADAPVLLYHSSFSQAYQEERALSLAALLARMAPHRNPTTLGGAGERWLLAEVGLGPSLLAYLGRSQVEASVGIAEWPPETGFDDVPIRRWLFRVPALPARLRPLVRGVPGLASFLPACPGAAVEEGFAHPVTLRACPVFDAGGLVLFRGRGQQPLVIQKLPAMGDARSLLRAELLTEVEPAAARPGEAPVLGVSLRLVPRGGAPEATDACVIPPEELPLLRRLAYAFGSDALRQTRIAIGRSGAILLREGGLTAIPLGRAYRRIHPSIWLPAGHEVSPALSPDRIFAALQPSPGRHLVFLRVEGGALAVDPGAFVTLEAALLSPEPWAPLGPLPLEGELEQKLSVLWLEPLGLRPLADAEPAS